MMRLKFDNFSLSFGSRQLFKNWNLVVPIGTSGSGKSLGVMGPSGIGKTSLLRALLSSLEQPNEHLELDPPNTVTAYVPQEPVLFKGLTIAANAKYFSFAGRYSDRYDEHSFGDLSRRLRLDGLFSSRRDPESLSGGERQRLMLLRAMSIRPELIVLDEPCSGMDATLKEEFLYYLQSLISSYGLASIYVSHHWDEMAFLSEQILYLTREGTPDDVAQPRLEDVRSFSFNPPTVTAFKSVFGPQSTLVPLSRTSDKLYEGGLKAATQGRLLLGCGPFGSCRPGVSEDGQSIRLIHAKAGSDFFRVAVLGSADSHSALGPFLTTAGTVYLDGIAHDRVLVQLEIRNGDPWLMASSLS